MRAVILIAGAALALKALSSNEEANTMTDDKEPARPAADPGEYGELKERLRARCTNDGLGDPDDDLINPDGPEAATALETQAADIARLREALFDWRNCWLCPVTDFESEVERLIRETDALIDPDDAALSPNPTSP